MSGFDITTHAVRDTAPVHLKGADGSYLFHDGKPVRIIIYGPGSEAATEVETRQNARAVKKMNDNEGAYAVTPPEVRAAQTADDLASLTHSFENLSYPPAGDAQGKDLFRALYSDKKLGFIPEQVLKAYKDWGTFLPA